MTFAQTLDRLNAVITSRQPGEQAETCRVRRQDLRELLHHFHRLDDEARQNQPPAPKLGALEEIKYLALTAGAPGHMPVPKALARMIGLCNRAGVTKKLGDLRPQFAAVASEGTE